MKLLRYGPAGSERPGLLDADGGARDLSGVVGDIAGAVLTPEGLQKLSAIDPKTLPKVDGNPRLGACVGGAGKFIGIGLNFADHAAETNMPLPTEPIFFMKATSCLCGPNDEVIKPKDSTKLDWEVELGFVIGKKASYVSEAEALDHIAGYCLVNDVSEREFQLGRPGGQWDKGKGCDTFGPVGPWLVTADEIGDTNNLSMWLEVNGKRYQDGNSATMVFKPAFLVAYLSRFFTLHPGDIVTTGTPPGVGAGQKPHPIFLKLGDEMRLGISGLGEQRQKVVAAP
jgi:2-keto-4-pentenoate hydratase/2-oxohepta-3-ene-1,7-dioic acid hydratase in catechol pathway